ncbi:tubulin-like doman-containing protein [Corynebacterium comes]|uniref:Tubulin-like protein n=1 Tax=Corynebacterium comes TaxID=2675218 RepID=A0A6B8W6J7_9CORY|nr:tubulin-like doman-containing protein [Corynebacterium comes]QGU05580.1 hypothetical protein CETAM_11740 [Corynebacterium comes]
MHKVLVVGCGGSGAKTLAYMMDQLKTTLAERLPERYDSPKDVELPRAWQFVSVDVPTVAERPGKNLANVPEAGGRYISCGSSDRYATVDTAVSNQLANRRELGTIASWALANPATETTPISAGAGQYRSIGRMLFLSKLQETQQELKKSWDVLSGGETDRELADLRAALYGRTVHSGESAKEQPLVFVVSSMAGGAGASMAIDVCRLLTGLEGNAVSLNSLFMVTPDIFSQVSRDQVAGTNPNALAMFAELVAAQLGSATEEDKRLFNALGVSVGDDDIPVGRIFPVGVRSGENGAMLGDGKPETVYRALGRGLAALMSDEGSMDHYKQFTLGNRGTFDADSTYFAWGASEPKNVPWGSFGYAQLSMGRDRYAEYAAQRLARKSVERLLKGHYDPTDESPADTQIQNRLENNRGSLDARLNGFLPERGNAGNWIYNAFQKVIEDWTRSMTQRISDQMPLGQNKRGSEWVLDVNRTLQGVSEQIDQDPKRELYQGVNAWAGPDGIQSFLLGLIKDEIAKYGVPYGSALLQQIRSQIATTTLGDLRTLYSAMPNQAVVLHEQQRVALENNRGRIDDTSGYVQDIVSSSVPQIYSRAVGHIAHRLESALSDFLRNFIDPLQKQIQEAHVELEKHSELTSDVNLGVAQLKTDVPALWPDETQVEVPKRFSQAANEVFLTEVDSFIDQFVADIIQSAKTEEDQDFDYKRALETSASRVVSGDWQSLSGSEKAPGDLLRLLDVWVSRELSRDPDNPGVSRDPRPARFEFKISTNDILDRARQYIRRPGFSFQQFISSSLREFVTSPTLTEHERRVRRQTVLSKFSEAMTYALPLAQINSQLVQAIYGKEVSYNFNFSRIPFGGDEVGSMLEQAVRDYPNHHPSDVTQPLGKALTNQGEERSIDIFGSYPNYAPIVFDSLLPPIEKQWRQTTGTRVEFWHGRRARSLAAALPLSDADRKAMVLGWYIGRLTGHVNSPGTLDTSDTTPVQIFDEQTGNWQDFDAPQLTPVSRFRQTLDWLPNLLESISLAWARVGEQPVFGSVKPYMLLRQLWDAEPNPSQPGRTTRGQRLLHEWLYSGERKSGDIHMIPGTEPGASPEARLAAAQEWLEKQHAIALAYIPSSRLGAGQLRTADADRPYGDITDRELASRVPAFADLAIDVAEATARVAEVLEECKRQGPPSAQRTLMPTSPFASGSSSSAPSMPGEGEF